MTWDLPFEIESCGEILKIRNGCDYRVVLDTIYALTDEELTAEQRIQCALFIFFESPERIKDADDATKKMIDIINAGEPQESDDSPKIMDWEHDFNQIAPPISRVLGYSVRDPQKRTHWYDFIGAYMEIGGDCFFATVISIRNKRMKGKKLEKWEQEFYRDNKKAVDLPKKLTEEDREWLDSDW